jgi:hypothetical protein
MEENMQPDPLSPQQDDQQPEMSVSQEEPRPEPLSVLDEMPLEATPVQEIVKLDPAPMQEVKPRRRNTSAIALGSIAFILLLAVAGVGYWAFTLNAQFTTTQQQLTALQGEHESLQADYAKLQGDNEKLNADFSQTKTDLDKTSGDLANAQDDLKKSNDANTGLKTKITSASKKAEILYAFSTAKTATDILAIDSLIKATNDSQLIADWKNFANSPSEATSTEILLYLMSAIKTDLK